MNFGPEVGQGMAFRALLTMRQGRKRFFPTLGDLTGYAQGT